MHKSVPISVPLRTVSDTLRHDLLLHMAYILRTNHYMLWSYPCGGDAKVADVFKAVFHAHIIANSVDKINHFTLLSSF